LRPDWDVAGVVHALGVARDRGDAATVAVAAILAAQNAANRTPGVIPLTGPHWASTGATTPRRHVPDRNETCATCYLAKDECRRRWQGDHEFESVAAARARVIATADRVPKVRRPDWVDGRPVREVELP
jgi:hypothetical protein